MACKVRMPVRCLILSLFHNATKDTFTVSICFNRLHNLRQLPSSIKAKKKKKEEVYGVYSTKGLQNLKQLPSSIKAKKRSIWCILYKRGII